MESHRLVQEGRWEELEERLATPEGKEEAAKHDTSGRLIFHLPEIYKAPLSVLRAAHEANPHGWVGNSYYTHPIFIAISEATPRNLAYMVHKNPGVANMTFSADCNTGDLPIHLACERGDDSAVKILLAAYPGGATIKSAHHQEYPFSLGIGKLETETLAQLLIAFPGAVREPNCDFELPLHTAIVESGNEQLIESIFYAYPEAANEQGGMTIGLPLHYACNPFSYSINRSNVGRISLKVLKMLLKEYPESIKARDKNGQMPLHTLCDGFFFNSGAKESVLNELIQKYPLAASEEDNDGKLPLDLLLLEIERGEENVGDLQAWSQLVSVAPQALLSRHKLPSPFVRLAKKMQPPLEVWRNAATNCPTAVHSVDDSKHSALSYVLGGKPRSAVLDESSYAFSVLRTTFRCLRHTYYDEIHGTVAENIPVHHMLLFCRHMFPDEDAVPLPIPTVTELDQGNMLLAQDSNGNIPFHIACCAPCPPDAKRQLELRHCITGRIHELIQYQNKSPKHMIAQSVMGRNRKGELPLHLLLKNEHIWCCAFDNDMECLLKQNAHMALVWDPVARLYPFMLAATNAGKRDTANACSTILDLLLPFVAFCGLTLFSANSDKHANDCLAKRQRTG
jgi:ankyrin repeat protein